MKAENKKIFAPVIFAFIIFNGIIIILKTFFKGNGFDTDFLMVANIFFFVLSLAGFFLQRKGLQSDNTNVFIRSVYSAILVKLFVCIIAVTIYAFIKRRNIDKSAIFFSMGLYIVYTSIEVATLMKVAKGKTNAKKRITS